jgi:diacylglycerol kinase family enzyme
MKYWHIFYLLHDENFFLQVLNGLISRDDPKEAMTVPIGIIPAGSDNSLVWTVLGVRDPISAAVAIVKVRQMVFF